MAVVDPLKLVECLKSSSISKTLANNDLDERSFNSNSFILLLNIIVLRVIFLPGRCIRKIHGSHIRNTDRICTKTQRKFPIKTETKQYDVLNSPNLAFRECLLFYDDNLILLRLILRMMLP